MYFTIFSDSTPRGGKIFYRVKLQSERKLSFLLLSELVGSEIGFLRNSSPAVSFLFFFIFIDLCVYLLLLILTAMSSPSFCHAQFVSRVNKI